MDIFFLNTSFGRRSGQNRMALKLSTCDEPACIFARILYHSSYLPLAASSPHSTTDSSEYLRLSRIARSPNNNTLPFPCSSAHPIYPSLRSFIAHTHSTTEYLVRCLIFCLGMLMSLCRLWRVAVNRLACTLLRIMVCGPRVPHPHLPFIYLRSTISSHIMECAFCANCTDGTHEKCLLIFIIIMFSNNNNNKLLYKRFNNSGNIRKSCRLWAYFMSRWKEIFSFIYYYYKIVYILRDFYSPMSATPSLFLSRSHSLSLSL